MLPQLMFWILNFAAIKGFAEDSVDSAKQLARQSRRAWRPRPAPGQTTPEEAINLEKRRNLARMAHQFTRACRLENTPGRLDVLAIETTAGQNPLVHTHKSAFSEHKS